MLAEYDFEIPFKPVKHNANAVVLSRFPRDIRQLQESAPNRTDLLHLGLQSEDADILAIADDHLQQQLTHLSDGQQEFLESQKNYIRLKLIRADILKGSDRGNYNIEKTSKLLFFKSDFGQLLVVPKIKRAELLSLHHDNTLAGHLGVPKTFERLIQRYYWKGMYADVRRYVKSCLKCSKVKIVKQRRAGLLHPIAAQKPFERVHLDLLGPLPTSHDGNTRILVAVDSLTRWTILIPLQSKTAQSISKAIYKRIITDYSCPKVFVMDQGKEFDNNLVAWLCKRVGIKRHFISVRQPQSNGKCERQMRVIAEALTIFGASNQHDWDHYLQSIAFAYRTSFIEGIKDTPFFLLHGYDASLPSDILYGAPPPTDNQIEPSKYKQKLIYKLSIAHNAAKRAQEQTNRKMKKAYDISQKDRQYAIGDLVLIHRHLEVPGKALKLSVRWDGPYHVTKKLSDVTYQVANVASGKIVEKVHVQGLQPFFARSKDIGDVSDFGSECTDISYQSDSDLGEYSKLTRKSVKRKRTIRYSEENEEG